MPGITNIGCLACCPMGGQQGDIGLLHHAEVHWDDTGITWIGPLKEAPKVEGPLYDAAGCLVAPGLIDCHTHLAFGGWREEEFAMRCQGKGYLEIAKAGGGIASTIKATRAASEEELANNMTRALVNMADLGVTTVECKTGYGLDEKTEISTLGLYREANKNI